MVKGERMTKKKNYNLAFILRDEQYGIDSLVYAEYIQGQLAIKTSQKVDELKYFITGYITGICASHINCDLSEVELFFFDQDTDTYKAYQKFKAMPKEGNLTVRSVADLVDAFKEYEHPGRVYHKEHSVLSEEVVPDFEHMTQEKTLEWEHYFFKEGV